MWNLRWNLKTIPFTTGTFAFNCKDKRPTGSKSSAVAKTSKRTKELLLLVYHVSTVLCECMCVCVRVCARVHVCVGADEQAHACICVSHTEQEVAIWGVSFKRIEVKFFFFFWKISRRCCTFRPSDDFPLHKIKLKGENVFTLLYTYFSFACVWKSSLPLKPLCFGALCHGACTPVDPVNGDAKLHAQVLLWVCWCFQAGLNH